MGGTPMPEVKWEYSREGENPRYTWGEFTVEWEQFAAGGQWNLKRDGVFVEHFDGPMEQVLKDCEAVAKRLA